jgi:hypothetical protein
MLAATRLRKDFRPMRLWLRSALASLVVLIVPATALAQEAASGEEASGTDRTTEIMFGLIIVLILAMLVIGVLEARKSS